MALNAAVVPERADLQWDRVPAWVAQLGDGAPQLGGGVPHHRARDWPVSIRTRQSGLLPVAVYVAQLVNGEWAVVLVRRADGSPATFRRLDEAKEWAGNNLRAVLARTDLAAWETQRERRARAAVNAVAARTLLLPT